MFHVHTLTAQNSLLELAAGVSDPQFWSDAKRFKSLVAEGKKKIDQFLGHLNVILYKIFDLKKPIIHKKKFFLRLDYLLLCQV